MARHSQEMPSRNEDEYFVRQDAELLKQMRETQDKERSEQERQAHWMKCPKCGGDLKEETHGHAKVDVCAKCGGMWLDAGEVEIVLHQQKAGGNALKGLMDLFQRSRAKK